jgi:hypothetical protein
MNMFREKYETSFPVVCDAVRIPYSTVMRWQNRSEKGEPVICKTGVKKVNKPDYTAIHHDLSKLKHGRKRTAGVRGFLNRFKDMLPRRELEGMVRQARFDATRLHYQNMRRVKWLTPGLVWAIDRSEFKEGSEKYEFLQPRDMASQYKFEPICRRKVCGEEIAGLLEKYFNMYGPPLFLKRDNHGSENHKAVDDVLERYMVIPLNSPAYYPQYNGAIEHDQAETKAALRHELDLCDGPAGKHMEAYLKCANHELNHKHRREQHGKNSCRVFFDGKEDVNFSKRKRESILDWIIEHAFSIIDSIKDGSVRMVDSAWRIAVETWLRLNGHANVRINGRVLPIFCPEISHH